MLTAAPKMAFSNRDAFTPRCCVQTSAILDPGYQIPNLDSQILWRQEVALWHRKLFAMSEVIASLSDIQRSWSYLETLFIGSEEVSGVMCGVLCLMRDSSCQTPSSSSSPPDSFNPTPDPPPTSPSPTVPHKSPAKVRGELPETAKDFEDLDVQLKMTFQDLKATENAEIACSAKGLGAKLIELKHSLEVCERQLQNYLESKKMLFGRFFFLSGSDLLDILSNGNAPRKVMRHMQKIVSAVGTLELTDGTSAC